MTFRGPTQFFGWLADVCDPLRIVTALGAQQVAVSEGPRHLGEWSCCLISGSAVLDMRQRRAARCGLDVDRALALGVLRKE